MAPPLTSRRRRSSRVDNMLRGPAAFFLANIDAFRKISRCLRAVCLLLIWGMEEADERSVRLTLHRTAPLRMGDPCVQ